MVRAATFLLVLSLALVASSLAARKCVLTGKWTNDLGSNMTIGELNGKGEFSGNYTTAVSASSEPPKSSPLLGSQHLVTEPTFGFTINWKYPETAQKPPNTTTVFTGQCFVKSNGEEVLKTMWLLRLHADDIKNNWKATMVGTNEFKRLRSQKE